MKTSRYAACAAAALIAARAFLAVAEASDGAAVAAVPDPTIAVDAVAARLHSLVAESGALRLTALVVGAGGEGAALVGGDAAAPRIVHAGSVVGVSVGGMKMDVLVRRVTAEGVELCAPGDGGETPGVMLRGASAPLGGGDAARPEFLRHVECSKTPLGDLMRLISDQAGVNIAVSDSAEGKVASIFLRNVTADEAVEEVCRATGLWFRRDNASGVMRIMSMEEYADNLSTFREEATEMFTLLYPNVIEVASVIYGIYPDRTFVSLGEEEFDEDDEYDLSRRFRRFRVLEENGGSQFMSMEAPQASSSGSRSGSGSFSFSRGGAAGLLSQWDELRRRSRRRTAAAGADAQTVGYDDAAAMEAAYRAGDTNRLDSVRGQATAAANIFVSLSRRNNMLVVRTSDSRVMDEIRALVRRLDVPTPMVLMEVKVLELSVDDDYAASFTYSFNRGTHAIGHDGSGEPNIFSDILQGGQNAINPTFAFKAVSDNITAQIRLLQRDGKIRTLATPTLLVANNEVARIFSGKEYPLVTGWTPGSATSNDVGGPTIVPSTPVIERQDVGTMLLITPNINADKTVTLRLLQENSELSADTAAIPVIDANGDGGDKTVQFIESRSLAGTFIANDGMTIMAGGLVKETEGETYWRTPILGSLPLVGWLFRGTEKVKERTELIVLIKPHVILTPIEGGRISQGVLDALSAHPAADGRDSMEVLKD